MDIQSIDLERALKVLGELLADLKRLNPIHEELQIARHWCVRQDVSDAFAVDLNQTVIALGVVNANS